MSTLADIKAAIEDTLTALEIAEAALADEIAPLNSRRANKTISAADAETLKQLEAKKSQIVNSIRETLQDAVAKIDQSDDIAGIIADIARVNAILNDATDRINRIKKVADAIGGASDGLVNVKNTVAKFLPRKP